MNSTQIIGAIMLATGKPVPEVAKKYGYSKHTFYRVIKNDSDNHKVRLIISSLIHKTIDEIWPPNQDTEPSSQGV